MRRKKSRRAFHLERTRCVRFNQANPTHRQTTLDEHGFRPHVARLRDDLKIPFPRFTVLSHRQKKNQ
jgi:hypothetical protein